MLCSCACVHKEFTSCAVWGLPCMAFLFFARPSGAQAPGLAVVENFKGGSDMDCCHHQDQKATVQCSRCGKGLCQECAKLYTPPLCADCVSHNIKELKQEVLKLGGIGIVIAIIYLFLMYSNGGWHAPLNTLLCGVVAACIPFGWNFITVHTPKVFLTLPVVVWAIYFLLKLIGGIFVGWIAAPWKIYKTFRIVSAVKEREQMRFKEKPKFHLYAQCVKCGYIGDIPYECPRCGAWYKSYINDEETIQQIKNFGSK